MTMSDNDIVERWNRLQIDVMNAARKAAADPEQAMLSGVVPLEERTQSGQPPEPNIAKWIRAYAKTMIPKAYDWDLSLTVGGGCFLTLKNYRPEDE